MSFIENVACALGIEDYTCTDRIVILGERGIYVEGVKSLKGYALDKVEIITKKHELIIKGKDLTIGKYCGGDLAVIGNVISVDRK